MRHGESGTTTPQRNTNAFLAPAVQAAVEIVEMIADQEDSYTDIFWTCNVFGEMAKILVQRNFSKYQDVLENLLKSACYSIADSWLAAPSRGVHSGEGEVAALRRTMQSDCVDPALSTYFEMRRGRFLPEKRPDRSVADKVLNAVVTWYFDRRLRSLLVADRPRVKEYATNNLPTVYRLDLPEHLAVRRKEWEQLLTSAGYEDVVSLLRDMGDLISAEEVGEVGDERRNDVRRAQVANDFGRIAELLSESANELKAFLYKEAQRRLDYREPALPTFTDHTARRDFEGAKRLAQTHDPSKLVGALNTVESLWNRDISNLGLRKWVAFLRARSQNLPAAESMFEQIRSREGEGGEPSVDWNLAVLAYNRKDEATAYRLLVPLVARNISDQDLIIVVLGLSLKFNDRETFLATIPRTMSRRFHPLAFVVAHGMGDKERSEELLGQLLMHWQKSWELPSVTVRLRGPDDLKELVNRAIVEGQVDQLIAWLRAQIEQNPNWVPNYLELARVLADEVQDIDGAYTALKNRLNSPPRFGGM